MNHLIALVCLATACMGSPLPDGKIFGGKNVPMEFYPYQLQLEYRGVHICGASIISTEWAVTAAQCVGWPVNTITLRAGSEYIGVGGYVHTVISKVVYPEYGRYGNYDYDIALLKVSSSFIYESRIQPISLPEQDESVNTGGLAVVSGWGTSSEDSDLSKWLQAVNVKFVDQSECRNIYDYTHFTNRMICAGVPEGGKGFCQGDVGGPLKSYENQKLVGVASWSYGCAQPDYPGVYTRVAAVREWIRWITGGV